MKELKEFENQLKIAKNKLDTIKELAIQNKYGSDTLCQITTIQDFLTEMTYLAQGLTYD